ncbi:MAG TPA: molybdopterin cofactor-binding domain-containing protein, partial [Limnochordia bacterium]|nr:molybdopterin cofactor-binding domain-containing protein [Limnochordia bacterium]
EFRPDGRLIVHTTSQAPFEVQRMLATYCKLHDSQVVVNTPLVGGAFGGKAVVHMEPLAALASQNLGGRLVRIANTREQDITSSPVAMGLECDIRLGARRDGTITTMQISLLMDAGAYTDSAPRISRAMASDCTGPYNVPNLYCDSLTVYTNHPYTTAYRGFGHAPLTTCVERMLDKLAFELGRDPIELRRQNALRPGNVSPTGVSITRSNLGDPDKCLERVAHLLNWSEGQRLQAPDGKIRAKGVALFWKTSSSPPDAISGAVLSYNSDGSVTLRIGAVEFGAATKTTAVQILAERLGMSPDRIGVHFDVNTQVDPEHWKTVASMSTFMVGRAVLEAAEDAIRQIKSIAAIVLRCAPGDLAVSGERAFLKDDPSVFIDLKDIGRGYKYDEGHGIGGQIIGRGCYIMRHLTPMDRETGAGKTGPAWTPGAQGVEVEYDPRTHHYRLLRAVSVIDAGRVVNPMGARGVVMGGMCMGLGYGSRECLLFDEQGRTLNDQLRVYKMMRYGEQPEYTVEFVETPQQDSPFGARGIGEHGVIGMPAALANALSAAAGCDLHVLPLTPERIWRTVAARPTEPVHSSEAGTTEPVRLGAAP